MFSTDGCMPGPQFDNPAEGCGLCLKLGSWSKAEQWAPIFLLCVCVCVGVCVCKCLHVLMVLTFPTLQATGELL